MATLYLIRHGQANFSGENYDELSAIGQHQAAITGGWLAQRGHHPQRVYAGTLQRQQHSARMALEAAEVDLPIHTLPGLDELDHQNILGVWRPEFADMAALRAWLRTQEQQRRAFQQVFEAAMRAWLEAAPHDSRYRESWPQFQQRSTQALRQILQDSAGCTRVWAFSSGGPMAAICQHLLRMDNAATLGLSWSLANCSITRILWPGQAPEQASIQCVNGFSHLENCEGMLTWR